jgi:hypothetical protein
VHHVTWFVGVVENFPSTISRCMPSPIRSGSRRSQGGGAYQTYGACLSPGLRAVPASGRRQDRVQLKRWTHRFLVLNRDDKLARNRSTMTVWESPPLGTPANEEKRPLRRQPEDHHFWSLIILAVTAGGFLLVTRGRQRRSFSSSTKLRSLENRLAKARPECSMMRQWSWKRRGPQGPRCAPHRPLLSGSRPPPLATHAGVNRVRDGSG